MSVIFNNPTIRRGGIVKDGLVLNLDAADTFSYPRSGTKWYDLSGKGYDVNLYGNPTYTSANNGMFSFDGIDDTARFVSGEIAYRPSVFSIQMVTNGEPPFIGCRNGAGWFFSSNTRIFTLFTIADYNLSSYTYNSNNNYITICTVDTNRFKRYVNGVLIDDRTISTSRTVCGDNTVHISSTLNSNGGIRINSASQFYKIQIYNRTLSDNEVYLNYNSLRENYNL